MSQSRDNAIQPLVGPIAPCRSHRLWLNRPAVQPLRQLHTARTEEDRLAGQRADATPPAKLKLPSRKNPSTPLPSQGIVIDPPPCELFG